ncbi:MAG: uracil-DNA glycosylase [Candidatus Nanopelagicales bacterium]
MTTPNPTSLGRESVHPSWLPAFKGLQEEFDAIETFLAVESFSGRSWLPAPELVFRVFAEPIEKVKVVILGQDPYPTPGHSVGLAFSVAPGITLPRSLVNIFRELDSDVGDRGTDIPASGDLTPWADQGVLLLNSVLTVQSGVSGSHRGKGWESITRAAITALMSRPEGPPIAILWGKDAQVSGSEFDKDLVISSAHPSPLSARRGFFGSRPFSRTNELLQAQGNSPIEWRLPY